MPRPVFLYATGTAFLTQVLGAQVGAIGGGAPLTVTRPSTGLSYYWDSYITNDPFWKLLDNQNWDSRKIVYPAATWPMGLSVDIGVTNTIQQINLVPVGTPFMLGGYSQGAAVMSKVYNEIRFGVLSSRAADFKGAVLFGNPMRQEDFTAPESTWSGSWDYPGSTTGGHGCFPVRLTNCELGKWREYVNDREIITAHGNSPLAVAVSELIGFLTGNANPIAALQAVTNLNWINGLGAWLAVGAVGHVAYPLSPPPNLEGVTYPPTASSSFELALTFMDEVAASVNAGPILPSTHPSLDKAWTIARPIPAA